MLLEDWMPMEMLGKALRQQTRGVTRRHGGTTVLLTIRCKVAVQMGWAPALSHTTSGDFKLRVHWDCVLRLWWRHLFLITRNVISLAPDEAYFVTSRSCTSLADHCGDDRLMILSVTLAGHDLCTWPTCAEDACKGTIFLDTGRFFW
jgi:hypothetical protein